ncbi:MAG TPA: endonuclease III, partial [Acidobacteriota bacterium]
MDSALMRIGPIIRILRRAYPRSRTALEFHTPLQMLVATILSAQCTDERVNTITPRLFAKYKSAADFASADPRELEAVIRPTGFFRNKARSIIGAGRAITADFKGRVPDTMEELLTL